MAYPMPFPEVIDSTILVTYRACPRKAAYSFLDNLAPSGGVSVDLHFGGCLAAALETARREFFVNSLPAREAEAASINSALDTWGDFTPPDGHAKTLHSLLASLDGYFQRWPIDSEEVRPLIPGAIEFTFAIPIPDALRPDRPEPIIWAGRFDLLGLWHDLPVILDEKTTGRSFSSSWSLGWNLRNQFLMYVWAVRQHGFHIDKVIVRGVSVLKTKLDFTEAIVTIPEHLVDRAYTQVVRDLTRFAANWTEGYFDYNFGDTCTSYGVCPFMDLCTAQNPREWYSLYRERNWNPLHKDPTT